MTFESLVVKYNKEKNVTQWTGYYRGEKYGNYLSGEDLIGATNQAKDIYESFKKRHIISGRNELQHQTRTSTYSTDNS